MIPTAAVKAFLARERRDVRPMKKTSLKDLHKLREDLPVKPPIWQKLKRHQRICFMLGVFHRSFGFHLDMGMGKTLLGIALARYFHKNGELMGLKRVLVLVPNKINKAEWARELRKWGQKDRYVVLKGSSAQKWEVLRRRNTLFVVETYAGFVRLVCQAKSKGRKRKLVPVVKLVRELQSMVGGVILDESTHVANRSALATRVCKQLKKTSAFLFEMTGTPFGRDPTMLHSQLHLLDGGHSLGETLALFRAAFFTEKSNYWGGFDYTFKRDMEPTLNKFLAHSTIRYEAEASDLPAYVPIVKVVHLPHDADAYVEKARAVLRSSEHDYVETRNAFLRMRQISSGWIGYEADEDGKRAQLEFDRNPKMDMLLSLVADTNEKIIAFHDFIFSGSIICRELTKAGIEWARISGETKEHSKILSDFANPAGPQVLVLNNRFSMGPNLQAAKYGIWFEAPTSVILKKQGRRRFERQHSEHKKVFGIDLVVKGTYDQRILSAHAQGEDLFEQIIKGRKKPKGRITG